MSRHLLAMMVVTLLACQTPESPSTPVSTTPTPSSATKFEQPTPLPRGQNGRLAYIGNDGNVYVTTADGTSTIAVTDDATTAPEGMGLSYHRISWSPDGRLAFAAVNRLGLNDIAGKLYITDTPGESAQVIDQSDENFFIYVYWSPTQCPDRPACRQLAYLIENDQGIGLHLAEIEGDQVQSQLVDIGQPFYFSWDPTGAQMLWHTGGAHRHNLEARIALYDLEDDRSESLPYLPGSFLAPAWSPIGDHWLGVSGEDVVNQLQSFKQDQSSILVTMPDHHSAFSWSPTGDQVAYAEAVDPDDLIYGPIHIFDLETGKSRQLTDTPFRIVGFFWSPNGQKIAYLKEGAPGAGWWQWRLYDLVEDRDRGFEAFTPSPHMRFIVASFNQYVQSHRLWSPDSRYLAYADRDDKLVQRVWLIDTWADKGADPIFVAEGTIGIWSWD